MVKQIPDNIAILMCTFNGERFLEEQLDSIYHQTYKNWTLYVSDDGSSDKTLSILKNYQLVWGKDKLQIFKGPRKGFQRNFMGLITSHHIRAEFYMLCDQDDVWLPHKVSRAIGHLKKQDHSLPQLYCSRTTYVSNNLKFIGYSDLYLEPTSIKNAIVQSIAGGNTMAFNNTLKIIPMAFPDTQIVSHDWWLYILCELSGGKTFYDKTPSILYRQHERSLVGSNTGFRAKLKRLYMLLSGKFIEFNDCHLNAFNKIPLKIANAKHLAIINKFYNDRHKPLKIRWNMIKDLGLYRQGRSGKISLYFAVLIKAL
jgi:glycosyltransferase involved in cell wall biosynthesis